jgi:hypothetical protein
VLPRQFDVFTCVGVCYNTMHVAAMPTAAVQMQQQNLCNMLRS